MRSSGMGRKSKAVRRTKPKSKRRTKKKQPTKKSKARRRSKAATAKSTFRGDVRDMSCGGGFYSGNGFKSVRESLYAGEEASFEIAKAKIMQAARRAAAQMK